MTRTFRALYGRKPIEMREDFCGTALFSCAWVKGSRDRRATGVDICGDTLAWGRAHNLAPLGAAAERIELLQQDVRAATRRKFDVINAMNFSYWIFRTRDELRHYFSCVHKALGKEGLFFLDAYGGWESQEPMLERRKIYTVAGEEVANLPIATGEISKQWTVVNSSGKKLASGVYLYLIEGNGVEAKGKIVVIR